jgi:replicative DNA helicase
MTACRVPANDVGAERALIGACTLDREIQQQLVDAVEPGHFYKDAHATIWEALRACERAGMLGDITALRGQLESAGKLARVGGDEYLFALTDTIPTLANAEALATRVRDMASIRAVVHACHEVAAEGY